MSNPTTPFGWQMPTATDLVTDLPADFEVFGQAVATSMADLLGGTSGQVLAKNSNTDMDFVWVTSDDANAIQNTIVDAKGDLIAASAADTPARLAVGSNGESLVADSSTSTGLRYNANYSAGKNKVINGDFYWNQRNFTSGTSATEFIADRIVGFLSGGTGTFSRELFTVGQTAVPGNPLAYGKAVITTGNDFARMVHRIEDVSTFAGQTATLSFYAKGVNPTTAGKLNVRLQQVFGSGGSASVDIAEQNLTLTASFVRYSFTFSVPSISGKTVGTSNYLALDIGQLSNASTDGWTLEVAQIQLEAGSVATAFQTATGTLQGELAACQRYYYRNSDSTTNYASFISAAITANTTQSDAYVPLPVTMRTKPSSVDFANLQTFDYVASAGYAISNVTINSNSSPGIAVASLTFATATAGRFIIVRGNNSSAAYLGFNSEL